MSDFFDASKFEQFESDEELFAFIIENVVKPQLQQALDEPGANLDDIDGKILVFGGTQGVDPEEIAGIQERVQEGVSLEYILQEMTNLKIKNTREAMVNNLTVQYIELAPVEDDLAIPSADDLEAMFLNSPDSDVE